MKGKGTIIGFLCLLILLTGVTFSPVLKAHFLNWDDEENVVYCQQIRNLRLKNVPWLFTNFTVGDFKPLTWITYALDYSLWGLNPFGYHLGNLLLHIINTVFLFLLILRLGKFTSGFRPASLLLPALSAALFFGLHPLRVESVAWVSDRKGVLGTAFYLAALIVYLRYAETKKGSWYLLTFFLFLLSLLSKPVAVSFPLALILLDFHPLERMSKGAGKILREKLPFLAAAAAAALMAFIGQSRANALVSIKEFGLPQRFLLPFQTAAFYLKKTIFPFKISAAYPPLDPSTATPFELFLDLGVIISFIALGVKLWRKDKRWLLTCWLWFLITLFPLSGFFRTGLVVVADRFAYLPAIGLSGLVTLALLGRGRGLEKRLLEVGAGIILAYLALLSFAQARLWNNSETLWEDAVNKYSESPVARSHYGQILFERGFDREAAYQLEEALKLLEGETFLRGDIGFAVGSNLAQALARQGRRQEAAAILEKILASRDEWFIHHILGGVYRQLERLTDASLEYELVLKKRPNWVPTLCDYGLLLAQSGEFLKAVNLYRRALNYAPESPRARYNLALAYLDLGEQPEALRLLKGLQQQYPDNYLVARALSVAYAAAGREEESIKLQSTWEAKTASPVSELPYASEEKPGVLILLR